jgi:hypothetical protein
MRQYREIKRAKAEERQANERAREANRRNFQFRDDVDRVMRNLQVTRSAAQRIVRETQRREA